MAVALSKDDWVQTALAVLGEDGIGAVAVEPLARRLKATKGSFYWHFPSRDALLAEVLAFWEHKATDAAIAELEQIADPVERLRQLLIFAMDDQDPMTSTDLAILAAGRNPIVRPVLARVQAKRMAFLERCFRDLGLKAHEAQQRARLAYSVYVGWFDLIRAQPSDGLPSAEERASYQRLAVELLTRT